MAKKKRSPIPQILMIVLLLCVGFGAGYLFAQYLETLIPADADTAETLFSLAWMLICLYAAIYLQTIVHEGGHLIFGLMTGYGFVSFRIGSLMLQRMDGKLRLMRFSLAGTGGQCLMSPPGQMGEDLPVMLYNFGGALMNLAAAALCLLLNLACADQPFLSMFLLMNAAFGLVDAVANGVPMKGLVNNDGHNALSLRKDPAARRSLWIQLKVNALQAQGVSIADMPEEWFVLPSDEALANSMIAPLGPFCSDRLMAQRRFADAALLQDKLLSGDNGVAPVHRALMTCDRIFCELIGENDAEVLSSLNTKKYRKTIAALKSLPSAMRTAYAQALLTDGDEAKAAKLLARFDKRAKSYPYPADIAHERALMELARDIHAQRAAAGSAL